MIPAGYPAHVVHRGNNRMTIFHSDADHRFFRRCLVEGGVGDGVALHSYVLMPNHVHLLMTAEEDNGISWLIHSAARRYAGYYNAKYGRTGSLWEGRFHSTVVTTEHYLMACHRYIDMNPVRAGIAASPEAFHWSSHRHCAFGVRDELVTVHSAVEELARVPARRMEAYRSLFRTPLSSPELEAIRRALRSGKPLGEGLVVRARPPTVPGTKVPGTIFSPGRAPPAAARRDSRAASR